MCYHKSNVRLFLKKLDCYTGLSFKNAQLLPDYSTYVLGHHAEIRDS